MRKKTGVINIDNIIDIGYYKIDIKYIYLTSETLIDLTDMSIVIPRNDWFRRWVFDSCGRFLISPLDPLVGN